ncbi:MAG: hypothetical protein EPO46_10910 [Lysobacter sp.]|nr:MAG: hypothetical protein EPO46_10910 [Lysobacter sp.]
MFRKLRNSLNALILASAITTTGVFALVSAPAIPSPSSEPGNAGLAISTGLADTHADSVSDAPRRPRKSMRIRHLMAMPYFSFVSRG